MRPGLYAGLLPRPGGMLSPDAGRGAGFAAGGVADGLQPGVALGGFISDVWAGGLDRITGDQLIGVLQGLAAAHILDGGG